MKHTMQNWIAIVIGVLLAGIGLIGFLGTPVFGVFGASAQLSVFHLFTGIVFIWCALANLGKAANVVVGIIYAIIVALSIIEPLGMFRLLAINAADDWLHLVIAAISLIAGLNAD